MNDANAPLLGVLGGMGPAATAAFYHQVVESVRAAVDQDHPRVAIWADATVPDRSSAILGAGEDPTPALLSGLRILDELGATAIAVPCNSAHYFLRRIAPMIGPPVVDMIEHTCRSVVADDPNLRRVGLLGTAGLVASSMYQDDLRKLGVTCVPPETEVQAMVTAAIAMIKGGEPGSRAAQLLRAAARQLETFGCEAIIAGCTEIPLGLTEGDVGVPLIDPSRILARCAVALVQHGRSAGEVVAT